MSNTITNEALDVDGNLWAVSVVWQVESGTQTHSIALGPTEAAALGRACAKMPNGATICSRVATQARIRVGEED